MKYRKIKNKNKIKNKKIKNKKTEKLFLFFQYNIKGKNY